MYLNCLFDAWCLSQSLLKSMSCHNDVEFSYLHPETLMCNFETLLRTLRLVGWCCLRKLLLSSNVFISESLRALAGG